MQQNIQEEEEESLSKAAIEWLFSGVWNTQSDSEDMTELNRKYNVSLCTWTVYMCDM